VAAYRVSRDGRVLANLSAMTRTYLDVGLAPGTYAYAVAAIDIAGNVGTPVTRTVRIVGPDIAPPSAPSNLSATTSDASVSLTWQSAGDNVGVTGYIVSRDGQQLATLSSWARSYRDSGLATDRTYRYTVRAIDGAGNIGPSTEVFVTVLPPDTEAPTAPQGLRVTYERRSSIRIAWDSGSDNVGVVSYRVYEDGWLVDTTSGTSTWARPDEGMNVYTVVAVDAAGNVSPASQPLFFDRSR
jgi:chitodextrinase